MSKRERDNSGERTLELADVRRDTSGDEGEDLLVVDVDTVDLHLLAQDRDPRLEVRRLDVVDQALLETASESLLERGDVAGRPVGGQDDLRAGLVQRVEGMEELLLEALFTFEELDVVDEEHVRRGSAA